MLQNLQTFAEFQKFQLDNLVDFEKCCETRIFLQNSVPIQPRTSNTLPKFCSTPPSSPRCTVCVLRWSRRLLHSLLRSDFIGLGLGCGTLKDSESSKLGKLGKLAKFKFCKFLAGSFSAVSKRNFARKYAFDSIFQALQDLHPFAPLRSQNFRKKNRFEKKSNFREISAKNLKKKCKCRKIAKFCQISKNSA